VGSISNMLGPAPEEANQFVPSRAAGASLLASGYLYKEIGDRLNIGVETVRTMEKASARRCMYGAG